LNIFSVYEISQFSMDFSCSLICRKHEIGIVLPTKQVLVMESQRAIEVLPRSLSKNSSLRIVL